MFHKLAAGIVVVKDDFVLLVHDKTGWSLPKGSTEPGETFRMCAERESFEETGIKITAKDVAFVTEYTSEKYGQYLQVYYEGTLSSGQLEDFDDPDEDVIEVQFVNVNDLRQYIKFRPWVIPLEKWIENRKLTYYSFDLDVEEVYLQDGQSGRVG